MDPVRLTTDRLLVEPLVDSDADSLFRYRSDPAVCRFQRWVPRTEEDAREFIARYGGNDPGESGGWTQLALRIRETGELAGDSGLRFPAGGEGDVEFGISLAPDHRSKGLAREGAAAIFAHLFEVLGVSRIVACADPRNGPSVRLMERLGMKREGLLLRSTRVRGEWTDDLHFSVDRRRWKSGPPTAPAAAGPGDLWAVTAFFNPEGYRSRARNFRLFREGIEGRAPLLAVELAYGEEYELGPGDADRLLRLRSDQVLWQKERLLNMALRELPDECRFLVWVDGDILFDGESWAEETREALEKYRMVQPFAAVHDLPRGAGPETPSGEGALLTRSSLARMVGEDGFDPSRASTDMSAVGSPGHAWAARRDLLEETGLYDAMIVGSGDNAVALAAWGHAESIAAAYAMNDRQAEHYLRWAGPFREAVGGEVGAVPGDIRHLWHGDLSDRAYGSRYAPLARFEFDPERDIAPDGNGAWRWNSEKPELHAYVRDYFRSRREDGRPAPK